MTLLTVWNETDPATPVLETIDDAEIGAALAELGARYSHWEIKDFSADASLEEILALYSDEVESVKKSEGYTLVDIVGLSPAQENYDEVKGPSRAKFLSEHRHDDDEDRFFAKGAGVFYLHVNEKVYALYCEPGDLVSVPANTTHWFDMGTSPEFTSIRFFHDDDGWVGHFTGNPIAETFATFDQLHARRAELATV
ncbi:1,2-dihydroxy-3-keto-5-methylthiopentene dioxygenase [Microbacterium endophyticum]|uniref:Acireductone dioxygenase n=1 Tax=Microbacterium endophyticum TaxID=1526412 RepID=A0A7W4YNL3_9MICO|nr:cupin [Microbacterium endophyticum]MBB2975806.1 1,2-dihydroxy-3-keto-5-methylthiopentene dioxygenase [Microbacterium endophyticum]NIK36289.1 1,2-dihydroxy-3-keto-5-methylthiopentene dioxygenase [Microbacterium endophyticum]